MTSFAQTRARTAAQPALLSGLESFAWTLVAAARRTRAVVTSFGFREVVLAISGYFAYFAVRGLTEGNHEEAVANSHAIVQLEKSAGFFWEPSIQERIVDHQWIVTLANWMYIWGHWPLIAGVATWLLLKHRDQFTLFRTAFFISGAIAVVVFVTFPVAPPRLAEIGLVDTVTEHSNAYRVLQPKAFTNQYAAVPSLHFGWDLLIGIAIIANARRLWVRALAAVVPVLMLSAIVLTANHYLLDAMAGGAVALAGLGLALTIRRYGPAFAEQFQSPYQRNVAREREPVAA